MVRCGLAGGAGTERGNDTGTRGNIRGKYYARILEEIRVRKRASS